MEIIEKIIDTNIVKLENAYKVGVKHSCWQPINAGINKAYDKLNTLLPENIRDQLTIAECMMLNTKIKSMLKSKLEHMKSFKKFRY